MKKNKVTSKLPFIISVVTSSAALITIAAIAVKLRKTIGLLKLRLDVLECESQEASEKINEIDKRKFYTYNIDELLKEVDIPDDSDIDIPDDNDIVDIFDDSDVEEDEIL